MLTRNIVSSLVIAALSLTACSVKTSSVDPQPVVPAEQALVTADVSKVTLSATGGLPGPFVAGSECSSPNDTYTLVLATRKFSWSVCETTGADTPAKFNKGDTFTLAPETMAKVQTALNAIKRTTTKNDSCMSDTPTRKVTLTKPTGESTYEDDELFCTDTNEVQYASGVAAALEAMAAAVPRDVAGNDKVVVPADASEITFTAKGGFIAEPLTGSTCRPMDDTYTVVPTTRTVTWKVCRAATGAAAAFVTGTKGLSESEYAPLATAFSGIKATTGPQPCGADKPMLTLSVKTPRGEGKYVDDFYRCNGGTTTYVSGLDAVETALHNVSDPR